MIISVADIKNYLKLPEIYSANLSGKTLSADDFKISNINPTITAPNELTFSGIDYSGGCPRSG